MKNGQNNLSRHNIAENIFKFNIVFKIQTQANNNFYEACFLSFKAGFR